MSDRDGNNEIYTMEGDGSGVVRLTSNAASDTEPEFSPDATRIAFVSDRDGHRELYVMNADGSGQTRVTTSPATTQNFTPTWSPDGAQLAFQTNRFGNFDVAVINPDGTNLRRLTTNAADDGAPSWSPDGDRIAFASNRDGDFEIFVRARGGTVTRVTRNTVADVDPNWSPDGTVIAFDSVRNGGTGDIFTIKPDGTGLARLTTSAGNDTLGSYSPDGTRLVFTSTRDGDQNIYTMTTSGGSQTRRTVDGFTETTPDWGRLAASTPPTAGKTATVTVVKGTVTIELPGTKTFVAIEDSAAIPIGATLDTTKGTVRVVTSDAKGGTQSGDFYEGVFKLTQKKGKALTDLKLSGGSFKSCPKAHKAVVSRSKSIRHLWGRASGKFRTTGKYASATVRGTTWETADRCDGTLIRVTKGSVSVRDLRRHRTIVVRARHSYLARKR